MFPRTIRIAGTVAGLAAVFAVPAAAQDAKPDAPLTVIANINDLGLLRALNPLQLTAEQTEKLVAVLKEVRADAKTRLKADEDALKAMAPELATARKTAVTGGAISEDLEKRVADAFKAADARQKTAKNAAIGKILAVFKTSLTPEQRDLIEKQSEKANGGKLIPAKYRDDPSKAPREAVQDLAAASFIDRVLLNERALEVLSEMKPAGGVK